MRLLTLLMLLCATFCYAQEKEPINRTWTSIAGTKVDAELVSYTDREVVLKLKQGKTIKLALNKLAEYDRYFLKGLERGTLPKDAVKEYELKFDYDETYRHRGKLITPARKNGKLFSGTAYRMYRKEGLQQSVQNIKTYKRGIPNGMLKIFSPNGKKVAEGNVVGKWRDGVWIFWAIKGKMIHVKTYEDREIVKGSEKYWNSKGEPSDPLELDLDKFFYVDG